MNFSNELNKYIDLLDCSAKDICKVSNLSPTIVSRYINGKRTPRIKSKYFQKIVDGIYILSSKKNINLSKSEIYTSLERSMNSNSIDYDNFIKKLNALIINLNIPNNDFAKALGYDASFISRIRNKKRKPSDIDGFINNISIYIAENYKHDNKKKEVSEILHCSYDSLNNINDYKKIITNWIVSK